MKFKDIVKNLTPKKLATQKKLLNKNLEKQQETTSSQLNATKVLNVLIHDMLDYAQLSAG